MNKQSPEYERVKEKIAIFLVARDDEISLEDAAAMWNKWKIVSAERGHSGDCTNEPETCFRCLVDSTYKDADQILSIKGIAILSDDPSWDCAGKVFVVGMNPSSFVELLEGKGFVKIVKEV